MENMKKIIYVVLALTLIFILIACDKQTEPLRGDGTDTLPINDQPIVVEEYLLEGMVAKIDGKTLTIEVTGGWDMITTYETVIAHLKDDAVWETEAKRIEQGQNVVLQIDGAIMESFPPQVNVISVWEIK